MKTRLWAKLHWLCVEADEWDPASSLSQDSYSTGLYASGAYGGVPAQQAQPQYAGGYAPQPAAAYSAPPQTGGSYSSQFGGYSEPVSIAYPTLPSYPEPARYSEPPRAARSTPQAQNYSSSAFAPEEPGGPEGSARFKARMRTCLCPCSGSLCTVLGTIFGQSHSWLQASALCSPQVIILPSEDGGDILDVICQVSSGSASVRTCSSRVEKGHTQISPLHATRLVSTVSSCSTASAKLLCGSTLWSTSPAGRCALCPLTPPSVPSFVAPGNSPPLNKRLSVIPHRPARAGQGPHYSHLLCEDVCGFGRARHSPDLGRAHHPLNPCTQRTLPTHSRFISHATCAYRTYILRLTTRVSPVSFCRMFSHARAYSCASCAELTQGTWFALSLPPHSLPQT